MIWKALIVICLVMNIITAYSFTKQINDLRSASMSSFADIDLLRATVKEKTDPHNMVDSIFNYLEGR